jgi:hypothetical protein
MFGCASGPNRLVLIFFWLLGSALLKFEPSSHLAAVSLRYLKWVLEATLDTGSGHFAILVMHRPISSSPDKRLGDQGYIIPSK